MEELVQSDGYAQEDTGMDLALTSAYGTSEKSSRDMMRSSSSGASKPSIRPTSILGPNLPSTSARCNPQKTCATNQLEWRTDES